MLFLKWRLTPHHPFHSNSKVFKTYLVEMINASIFQVSNILIHMRIGLFLTLTPQVCAKKAHNFYQNQSIIRMAIENAFPQVMNVYSYSGGKHHCTMGASEHIAAGTNILSPK
jgi:hypothetical protein